MTVTLSLGTPSKDDFTGSTVDELRKWIDSVNKYGAGLSVGNVSYEIHETIPAGQIISMSSFTTGSSINVVVSKGRNIFLQDIEGDNPLAWADVLKEGAHYSEQQIRSLIEAQSPAITNVKYIYKTSDEYYTNEVISIVREDTKEQPQANTYLPQTVQITVVICEKGKDINEEE